MGKKLEQIDPLEYGISGKELVAAAAVKAYLRALPPQKAATQLSQAIKPKIIRFTKETPTVCRCPWTV